MSEFIVRETGYPGTIKQEIVRELIRCKDCEWWRQAPGWRNTPACEITATACDEDHFCSWGERKETDDEAD